MDGRTVISSQLRRPRVNRQNHGEKDNSIHDVSHTVHITDDLSILGSMTNGPNVTVDGKSAYGTALQVVDAAIRRKGTCEGIYHQKRR